MTKNRWILPVVVLALTLAALYLVFASRDRSESFDSSSSLLTGNGGHVQPPALPEWAAPSQSDEAPAEHDAQSVQDAPSDSPPESYESLLERYRAVFDIPLIDGRIDPAAEAMMAELLQAMLVDDPYQSIENLIGAMQVTPDESALGFLARNHAGGLLEVVIGQDLQLATRCHSEFVESSDPATQTMMLVGLLRENGFPEDNVIDDFEKDMFEIAKQADDGHLRMWAFGSIAKSADYELMDEMVDHLLEDDLALVGRVMKSIHRQEERWSDRSSLGVRKAPTEVRNSKLEHARKILEYGASTREDFTHLMTALHDMGQEHYIHVLRAGLREEDFDPAYLASIDRFLETVSEPIAMPAAGDRRK